MHDFHFLPNLNHTQGMQSQLQYPNNTHELFCSECGEHVAIAQEKKSLVQYCNGSGKVIAPNSLHFQCLECQKLYLDPFHFENTAICIQCAHASGMVKILEWEKHKDDHDTQGKTQLIIAIESGNNQETYQLLKKGVDPNTPHQSDPNLTPLRIAIQRDHIQITNQLLKFGANLQKQAHTLIQDAVALKSTTMIIFLLKNQITIPESWVTQLIPLFAAQDLKSILSCLPNLPLSFNDYAKAVQHGDLEILKVLHQFESKRTLKNIRSECGENLLHIQINQDKHQPITHYLLKSGLDINQQDQDSNTPLHLAAQCGHLHRIQYLLKEKAKINAKNQQGSTPLEKAASRNQVQAIQLLIQHGANIHLRNHHGWSALDIAVQHHHLDATTLFIEAGVSPDRENQGWTPLAKAVADKQARLVSKLIRAGADPNHACVLLRIQRQQEEQYFLGQ